MKPSNAKPSTFCIKKKPSNTQQSTFQKSASQPIKNKNKNRVKKKPMSGVFPLLWAALNLLQELALRFHVLPYLWVTDYPTHSTKQKQKRTWPNIYKLEEKGVYTRSDIGTKPATWTKQ